MYLITGAEGYVGSHLVQYLNERDNVVDEFQGDVCNEDDWKPYAHRTYSAVIHLAALTSVHKSIEEPDEFFENNVYGSAITFNFALIECFMHLVVTLPNGGLIHTEQQRK